MSLFDKLTTKTLETQKIEQTNSMAMFPPIELWDRPY